MQLVDAFLDSAPARKEPVAARRLQQENGTQPPEGGPAMTLEAVRKWLQRAQRRKGSRGQSNATRQIRLVFDMPDAVPALKVMKWLAGPLQTPARE